MHAGDPLRVIGASEDSLTLKVLDIGHLKGWIQLK